MSERVYELAVKTLNHLQTPLGQHPRPQTPGDTSPTTRRERVIECWERLGFKTEDLNQLNAIHVAGTQGKGSVCAFCESILRHHGYKTGFLSSPHLMEVRERIRINGKTISREQFAHHFWIIYDQLESTRSKYNDYMPTYPVFLTTMGFAVFMTEEVDVAIVEVGMGGTNDSTNAIHQPSVCAVTSLGYNHTDQLGSTIEEIAAHKGGIFKSGRPALTVPQPYTGALQTLARRASELHALSLHVVPELCLYPGDQPVPLGLTGKYQKINASLAVQACKTWLNLNSKEQIFWKESDDGFSKMADCEGIPQTQPFFLTEQMYKGLKMCHWPGRNQIIQRREVTYYLDGAHTPASMNCVAEWFKDMTSSDGSRRILIFNTTRKRDPKTYLHPLMNCGFTHALFCPNIATPTGKTRDTTRMGQSEDEQQSWCKTNQTAFMELDELHIVKSDVFQYISLAIEWIQSNPALMVQSEAETVPQHISVLVTGSLHLVGATMEVLGVTLD